jgi:TPP-dependent pyruvate/acetoin dehydrogenase alpha subunit
MEHGLTASKINELCELHQGLLRIRHFEEGAVDLYRMARSRASSIDRSGLKRRWDLTVGFGQPMPSFRRIRAERHGLAQQPHVTAMFAELVSRSTGGSNYRGGSVHIADLSVVLGRIGRDDVVAAIVGEGALGLGEGLK